MSIVFPNYSFEIRSVRSEMLYCAPTELTQLKLKRSSINISSLRDKANRSRRTPNYYA